MRKHFLLLLLMTLLPLAGWAVDVEVRPFDASVVWTGTKPATVQASWITCSPAVDDAVKTEIATALTIQDLDNYNVGNHTYKLQKLQNSVLVSGTTYNLMVSSSYSAELTIEKFMDPPVFTTTDWAFVGDELVYTSQPQALLASGATATANGFSVPVVYATSATAENWVALADLKETNANTTGYTVYYKVVGTDNYAGSEVQTWDGGTKAIAKATITFNVSAAASLTYNGAPQALLTLTDGDKPATNFGASTLQYKIDDAEWAELPEAGIAGITGTSAKNGVAYSINLRVPAEENGNWDATEIAEPIATTIAKATPIFTYVPTLENGGLATGLGYDGQSHQLVLQQATAIVENTEISVPVKYSMRRYKNVSKGYTVWSDKTYDQLVGTFASSQYQIKVKTDATDDLNQAIQALENVAIAKATIPADAYTEPVAKNVRTTGAAQPLVDAATWTGETTYGTFQYSLTNNGTDWSTDIPQGTDVAEYPVYWRIYPTVTSDTQNYDIVSGNYTSNIIDKSKVTVTTTANQSFGYGTTPTLEYTAVWDVQGSDALNVEGLTWKFYAENDAECTGDEVEKVNGYYPVGTYNVIASGLAVTGTTAASQKIVYVPALVKITAGQVNATISGTATYGSLPVFTLTHTSGLSEAEAENFNAANNLSKVTVKKGTEVLAENVAPNADGLKALAVGEYDLEATATIEDYNYAVFVIAGKLNVSAKADAELTVTITAPDGGFTYKAAKWENFDDNVTVKDGEATLTKGTDYTITYGDDDHDNTNAGTGIVKIAGAGNYAGSTASQTFAIAKAPLTIKADDFTGDKAWTYGTTEPTYTITATGWLESGDALAVGGTIAGINGTLQVKRTSNTSVGMHTDALVPYFKDGDEIATRALAYVATNYELDLRPGNLQIAKAALAIKLKEAVVGTYGDDPATNITADVIQAIANYELDNCELPGANLADVVNVASVSYDELEAIENNKYVVGTDYEFTLTGATSTNYTVTISKGTYKVDPAAITLYAKDQAINWADEDNTNDEANKTVSEATVAIAAGALKCGDALTDVIASINIAGTQVGNNNITLTAKDNDNYNITVNKDAEGNDKIGNLTVTGGATITLTRVAKANIDNATVAQLIKDYDGQPGNVTIKFADTDGLNTLKPNKWYAFILPFETDAKMISDAFGYAIVDLLNEGNTDTHKTVFSLKMNTEKIPANTPFIIKVWDTVDMTEGVTFNGVEIVAPEAYDEIAVSDAAGNQFIGSYTGINGLGTYKPGYSGHVFWWSLQQDNSYDNNALKAKDTAYLRQMSAFSYVPGDVAAHSFVIEELGGNTTVIRGINIDGENISTEGLYNLNGMKLNSVPTQKGIYIQNGKKVVIK